MKTTRYISASEAKTMVDDGATLIDVRTTAEFQTASIPNSVNIPLDRIEQLGQVNAEKIIILCHSGVRTRNNQFLFEELVIPDELFILEHGIVEWFQAGLPIAQN